jgi:hypothetical protein
MLTAWVTLRGGGTASRRSAGERGSAVFVLLLLLSIMVVLVVDNSQTTNRLWREVKRLDKKQVERLAASETNRPPSDLILRSPFPKP